MGTLGRNGLTVNTPTRRYCLHREFQTEHTDVVLLLLRDRRQISILILSEFTHFFSIDPFSTPENIRKP